MNKSIRNLLIIVLLLLLAIPTFAQGNSGLPINIDLSTNEIIATFGGLIVTIVSIGFLIIGYKAIAALGISIPVDALNNLNTAAINFGERKLEETRQKVEATPDKTDDLIFSIARIPADILLNELKQRGITIPEPVNDGARAEPSKIPPFIQEEDVPINTNPLLIDGVTSTEWPGGRAKDVPRGYDLDWYPIKPDDPYGPPPEIHIKSEYGGMKAELAHRRGTLRITQNGNHVEANRHYLLVAHGTINAKLKADAHAAILNLAGRLRSATGLNLVPLPAWSINITAGEFAVQWPLKSNLTYTDLQYELDLIIGNRDNVPFDDESAITIHDVEFKPVDANYGKNALITF